MGERQVVNAVGRSGETNIGIADVVFVPNVGV
jgi:hypothetical protein